MADKTEIKKCLDELGLLLQEITTMEEEEEEEDDCGVVVEGEILLKKQSFSERAKDLAAIANEQTLDQLYHLLEIEV